MPEKVLYFAYGSNMLSRRLKARVPSATAVDTGFVCGRRLTFHKVSIDGSGKCDLLFSGHSDDNVSGVLFEIQKSEEPMLDRAEGSDYAKCAIRVVTDMGIREAVTYVAKSTDPALIPYHWYKELVIAGAREHRLPDEHIAKIIAVISKQDADVERRRRNEAILGGSACGGSWTNPPSKV